MNSATGDRESRVLCEVDPNRPVTFDLTSSSGSSCGDSETETCSEGEDPIIIPPHTPSETTPTSSH